MTDDNPQHSARVSSAHADGGLRLFQFSLGSMFAIVTVMAVILSTYFGVGRLVGMSNMEVLTQGFGRLVFALPTLVVWVVGLTMAFRLLKRNRLPATLAIIALSGCLITSLTFQVVQMALIYSINSGRISHVAVSWGFTLVGVLSTILNTTWWILVVAAIFARRAPDAPVTERTEPGNPFLTNEPHTP